MTTHYVGCMITISTMTKKIIHSYLKAQAATVALLVAVLPLLAILLIVLAGDDGGYYLLVVVPLILAASGLLIPTTIVGAALFYIKHDEEQAGKASSKHLRSLLIWHPLSALLSAISSSAILSLGAYTNGYTQNAVINNLLLIIAPGLTYLILARLMLRYASQVRHTRVAKLTLIILSGIYVLMIGIYLIALAIAEI